MNTIPRPPILPMASANREPRPVWPRSVRPSRGESGDYRPAPWPPAAGAALLLLPCAIVAATTGCTSALSSAYLRAMPWETAEHAAEPEAATDASPAPVDDPPAQGEPRVADDEERRAAAIDEAVSRLSRLGTLDEAAAASLVATLHGTQQEDWPVVIAEFAAALGSRTSTDAPGQDRNGDAANAGPGEAISTTSAAPPHVVAKADLTPAPADVAASAPRPSAAPSALAAPSVPQPVAPHTAAPAAEPGAQTADAAPAEPAASAPPSLRIANACFASRVQAWGVVDRFPADRFRAGREVIVYFELDQLSSQATAAGHTTCIDTVLRLVDTAGTTVHEWNFEPIAETCAGRRHDYFARYVVRLPADVPPGSCRLQVLVTDTLANVGADATLSLEILPAAGSDAG